ncbi:MAG: FHA domain-containing protein [Betaproteobacteria bacterium]|nr:FHA domain-containing protein [Betaproteobacteria bacterium]
MSASRRSTRGATPLMTLVPRHRTILFADVSDSTTLYETLGDGPAARAIEACLDGLQAVVKENGGQVVKRIGDEVMAAFDTPSQASVAAQTMQVRVSGMAPVSGIRMGIRVGFHDGPVLEDNGDYWGDCVNVAARLAGLAKSGQIYATGATVEALPEQGRGAWRDLSSLPVRGKADPMQVFQFIWDEDESTTQLVGTSPRAFRRRSLSLRIADREIAFPLGRNSLTVGRSATCDVVVAERTASRVHARIERRVDQYFLVDESTNGTYLYVEGAREQLLRRDQALLDGQGYITLGVPGTAAGERLEFDCR